MKTSNNITRRFRPYKDDQLRIKRRKRKRYKMRRPNYGFQGPPPSDNRLLSEEELNEVLKDL